MLCAEFVEFLVFRFSSGFLFSYIQWTTVGSVDVNIGANPSAEGDGDDEGVDDQSVKVVDIVDTFRLQVGFCLTLYTRYLTFLFLLIWFASECANINPKCFFFWLYRSNHLLTRRHSSLM